jgi:hypothetical protein
MSSSLVTICHTVIALALVVAFVLTRDAVLLGVLAGQGVGAGVQSTKRP